MDQDKNRTRVLVISSIVSGIFFYVFLYILIKWFPVWTGRTLATEWILVFVPANPIIDRFSLHAWRENFENDICRNRA